MGNETYVCRDIRGQRRVRRVERAIAAVAGRQYGTITRDQLRCLGLSDDAINRRLAAGRLHLIHRGVYAVGHRALTRNAHWLAAVLAGGSGAALSNQAAGAMWSFIAYSGRPHVTVPRWKRPQPRITWHVSLLPADEVTHLDGIPITTVARTLLDLASVLDRHRLAKAIDEAEARGPRRPPLPTRPPRSLPRSPGHGQDRRDPRRGADRPRHSPHRPRDRVPLPH